ncbi:hypothetical protein GQ55_9G607200 [Panicum hallii var. hallii]|uniref:Uncharacterized protein n=1 Tax=Panicum hallii var. hallii TaxID=1504633 RepID=A0A2T7CHB5_9POAL|nr:hypothetical protein GQ55_9G607200 [Panicum hallii var. hallii]
MQRRRRGHPDRLRRVWQPGGLRGYGTDRDPRPGPVLVPRAAVISQAARRFARRGPDRRPPVGLAYACVHDDRSGLFCFQHHLPRPRPPCLEQRAVSRRPRCQGITMNRARDCLQARLSCCGYDGPGSSFNSGL